MYNGRIEDGLSQSVIMPTRDTLYIRTVVCVGFIITMLRSRGTVYLVLLYTWNAKWHCILKRLLQPFQNTKYVHRVLLPCLVSSLLHRPRPSSVRPGIEAK